MYDSKRLFQDSSIIVEVCDCKGDEVTCSSGIYAAAAAADVTLSIYVLAAILCFLGKQAAYHYESLNENIFYIYKYYFII